MVQNKVLKEYVESLPDSMTLKKKVIKVIMKSEQPLAQKEILDALNSKDWTNVRRILRDLLDEGLIVKKMIGTKEYYVKVSFHEYSTKFVDGTTHYFIDAFEPDYPGEETYVRIKQAEQIDRDSFETIGKITIRSSQLKNFENEVMGALLGNMFAGIAKKSAKKLKK